MLRNGMYNIAGQAIRGTVSLVSIPLLVRFLGIREYGVWSLSYAVLALMTMSEAGLSIAAAVFIPRDLAEDDPRALSETLTVVLAGAVLLATVFGFLLWFGGVQVIRPAFAFSAEERTEAGHALQFAGLACFVYVIQRALVGIEQAFDRYAVISALDVCQSLLGNVGLILVASRGGLAVSLMKWQLSAWTILLGVHCLFVFRLLHGRGLGFRWATEKVRKILRFSAAAWASALGSAAFGQCDRLIVGAVLGAPSLGVYSAITNITSRINTFSGTAVQPLVPSVSRDAAKKLPVLKQIRQAVHLNALIAMEAGIFLFVLADWVMRVMVPGVATSQNILCLQIAVVIYSFYSLNAPGYFILFSTGKARTNAFLVLASGGAALGLILVGARYLGIVGALAGNVGYIGTVVAVFMALRRTEIRLLHYLSWVALPCLCFIAASLCSFSLTARSQWRLVVCAAQAILIALWLARKRLTAAGVDAINEGPITEN